MVAVAAAPTMAAAGAPADDPLELAEVAGLADDVSKAFAALAMLPSTFCDGSSGGASDGRPMVAARTAGEASAGFGLESLAMTARLLLGLWARWRLGKAGSPVNLVWGARLGSLAMRLAGDTGGVDGAGLVGGVGGAGRRACRPNEDSVAMAVEMETGCGVSKLAPLVDGVAADGYWGDSIIRWAG